VQATEKDYSLPDDDMLTVPHTNILVISLSPFYLHTRFFTAVFFIWQTCCRRFSHDCRALSLRQCELTVALFPQTDEILLFLKKKRKIQEFHTELKRQNQHIPLQ